MKTVTTIVAPTVAPIAPAAPKSVKREELTSSLLNTVRALDGNKEDRAVVARAALYSAYHSALFFGNKTQLKEVLESTGKKLCEKAMRNAVQIIGVPAVHKNVATRQDALDEAVMLALDLFAAVACVTKAKAVKVEAPKVEETKEESTGEGDTNTEAATPSASPATTFNAESIATYAATLPDTELAALTDRLMAIIEARTRSHLKVA